MSAGYPEGRDRSTDPDLLPGGPHGADGAVGTVEQPLPLIIDSDPGLDDALAIGLAVARPELDLLAVTTVGGNADVRHCTENALRLLHVYGRDDVPVAEGAAGPLVGESSGRPRSTARAASGRPSCRRRPPRPARRAPSSSSPRSCASIPSRWPSRRSAR